MEAGWSIKFVSTIPLIWLFILAILEVTGFTFKTYFEKALNLGRDRSEMILEKCPANTVPNPNKCPIYKFIIEYFKHRNPTKCTRKLIPLSRIEKDPNAIGNGDYWLVIWSIVYGVIILSRQASFFEVISIQFFIAFLLRDIGVTYNTIVPSDWDWIRFLYLAISICVFIFALVVQTYIYKDPSSQYTNVKSRIAILALVWCIMMLL